MNKANLLVEGVSPRALFLGERATVITKTSFLALPKILNESRFLSEDDFKVYARECVGSFPDKGYELWKEFSNLCPDGIIMAYNMEGKFIGDEKDAKFFCCKLGVIPETYGENKVCSIGFNKDEQAWYGWSHRAISPPFKVGYSIDDPDHLCCSSGWTADYLAAHPEANLSLPLGFTANNLDDCKRLAIAYADAVA